MNSQQKRSSLNSCSGVVDVDHQIDTTTANQIQFFTSNKTSSSSSQVYLFDVKFPEDGSQKVKVAVFRHTITNGSKKRKYEEFCSDDEDDPEQTAFKKVKELSNNKAGNYDEIEIRDCDVDVDLGDVAAIQYPVSACFNQPVEQHSSSACYNPNVIERRHKPQFTLPNHNNLLENDAYISNSPSAPILSPVYNIEQVENFTTETESSEEHSEREETNEMSEISQKESKNLSRENKILFFFKEFLFLVQEILSVIGVIIKWLFFKYCEIIRYALNLIRKLKILRILFDLLRIPLFTLACQSISRFLVVYFKFPCGNALFTILVSLISTYLVKERKRQKRLDDFSALYFLVSFIPPLLVHSHFRSGYGIYSRRGYDLVTSTTYLYSSLYSAEFLSLLIYDYDGTFIWRFFSLSILSLLVNNLLFYSIQFNLFTPYYIWLFPWLPIIMLTRTKIYSKY